MRNLIVVFLISFACFAINNAFQIRPKIINGLAAKQGQFPYYAFLAIKDSDGRGSACGASLISDEWLVTAAHCVQTAEKVSVHLGKSQLDNSSELGHVGILVQKDNIHVHPCYFEPIALNDIALIHLPQKVEFSPYIQAARLPATCAPLEMIEVVAIGHGAISDNTGASTQLNYAPLTTIPLSMCNRVYPILFGRKSVTCAYSKRDEAYQSICKGDSGGPLVSTADNTLIGVSNFVHKVGCEKGAPQGFANLYSYLGWIRKQTGLDVPDC